MFKTISTAVRSTCSTSSRRDGLTSGGHWFARRRRRSLDAKASPVWSMTTAFAQVVLAVGVVALLAERIPAWVGSKIGPISWKKN